MSDLITYRLKSDVRYRLVEKQVIVIRQSDGEVLVLNEVAGTILRQIEKAAPLGEIVTELMRIYEVAPSQAEADSLAFLGEMVEAGVLEKESI